MDVFRTIHILTKKQILM